MSFDEVKDRTSSAMGEGDDGGVFDEMITAYSHRRRAAQDLLVSALAESHSKAFTTYGRRAQFTTVGDSPVLDEPLHVLTRNLDFLARALSTASYRRVWRE